MTRVLVFSPLCLHCVIFREMVVFAAGDVLSQTLKALTFYRKESFYLEAWYQHPDKIPYSSAFIGKSPPLLRLLGFNCVFFCHREV